MHMHTHTLLKGAKRINLTTALGIIRPLLYPGVWEVTAELTSAFSCLGPQPKSDFSLLSVQKKHTHIHTHFPHHVDHLIFGLNWGNERGRHGPVGFTSPTLADPCRGLKSDTAPVTFPELRPVPLKIFCFLHCSFSLNFNLKE